MLKLWAKPKGGGEEDVELQRPLGAIYEELPWQQFIVPRVLKNCFLKNCLRPCSKSTRM